MQSDTSAHEFLTELGEANSFIRYLLASPRNANWHWPSTTCSMSMSTAWPAHLGGSTSCSIPHSPVLGRHRQPQSTSRAQTSCSACWTSSYRRSSGGSTRCTGTQVRPLPTLPSEASRSPRPPRVAGTRRLWINIARRSSRSTGIPCIAPFFQSTTRHRAIASTT